MSDTSVNGVEARHSSATAEHFTPGYIVEAARLTLGAFDLDPFSCAAANDRVKASQYGYASGSQMTDGFFGNWHGRVFCNPPGGKLEGQSNQKRAWFKLAKEYKEGRVTSAIFVAFSLEMLQTTQVKTPPGLPTPLAFPICYPSRRVAYIREDGKVGKSPPHASCIILLPDCRANVAGDDVRRFREAFSPIGQVVAPR